MGYFDKYFKEANHNIDLADAELPPELQKLNSTKLSQEEAVETPTPDLPPKNRHVLNETALRIWINIRKWNDRYSLSFHSENQEKLPKIKKK